MESTILVIDDDALLRASLCEVLELAGLRTITARNGVEAHALAESERPSAIVLDLMMPVAGGIQFLQRLRSEGLLERVPVVLYSGSADLEREAQRLGANCWLRKPCPPEQVLGALRELIDAA